MHAVGAYININSDKSNQSLCVCVCVCACACVRACVRACILIMLLQYHLAGNLVLINRQNMINDKLC